MTQVIWIKKIIDLDDRDRVNIFIREKVEHIYPVTTVINAQLWSNI